MQSALSRIWTQTRVAVSISYDYNHHGHQWCFCIYLLQNFSPRLRASISAMEIWKMVWFRTISGCLRCFHMLSCRRQESLLDCKKNFYHTHSHKLSNQLRIDLSVGCHLGSCLLSPVFISWCSKFFSAGMSNDNMTTISCTHITFFLSDQNSVCHSTKRRISESKMEHFDPSGCFSLTYF